MGRRSTRDNNLGLQCNSEKVLAIHEEAPNKDCSLDESHMGQANLAPESLSSSVWLGTALGKCGLGVDVEVETKMLSCVL